MNVMGTGMVIDIEHLVGEIGRLREKGIEISPENLKISDRATICMPYHRIQDCLEEDRLSDKNSARPAAESRPSMRTNI